MGNFYTNIVVREADIDRVVSADEGLRRRAYVAAAANASVVYDERCDDQDLDELQKLAGKLSEKLGHPAVAFCNHDDDVLWYALAEGGKVVDTYDSCPGYFDGGSKEPKGGDAARLCAAFEAEDKRSEVDALLRQEKRAVTFEVERHQRLLELLRLPNLALLGYRYVNQGEFGDVAGEDAQLRPVGGAPPLFVRAAAAPSGTQPAPAIDPWMLAALQTEGATMVANAAALAVATVEVPDPFAGLLPAGSANGYAVFFRLQRYVIGNNLGAPTGMVRPDEALARIVGKDEFPFVALARLVREAFKVPPLSAEDEAALKAGGAAFMVRFQRAMRDAIEA